jgi:hypothetical protein
MTAPLTLASGVGERWDTRDGSDVRGKGRIRENREAVWTDISLHFAAPYQSLCLGLVSTAYVTSLL